jgi:hypothetical protein
LGANETIFSSFQNGSNYFDFRFNTSDQLFVQNRVGAVNLLGANTTAVYRDPSAWYHIMFVFDSDNATAANRNLLYVNGVLVALSANSGSGDASNFNASGYEHDISGSQTAGLWALFDGELAEVNFVDGQALAPTLFGATDANSQWLPKAYTGTYGTNGFYLPFTNTTSTSTLVADSSGNANNWTPNNISLTAGSTYDSLTDVPTLTSATVANYCVINPLSPTLNSGTISNGNLKNAGAFGGSGCIAYGTIGVTSGKFYFEVESVSNAGHGQVSLGIYTNNSGLVKYSGDGGDTGYTTYGTYGVAFDVDAGKLWYRNTSGSWVSGDPATGASPTSTFTVNLITFPYSGTSRTSGFNENGIGNWNFGQQPFTYTAPTGFLPLNTFNIAAGTVTTSGTFTGNLSTDGPMVYLNGTPTAMTINGNAVTFGTQADKLANGFKVRSSSASYNASGSNTYVATTVAAVLKYENAQPNP